MLRWHISRRRRHFATARVDRLSQRVGHFPRSAGLVARHGSALRAKRPTEALPYQSIDPGKSAARLVHFLASDTVLTDRKP